MRAAYQIIQSLSLLQLGLAARISPPRSPPTVSTTNGTVVGIQNTQFNQDLFLGIPYAQPPVGGLRFRHALPLNESWAERQTKDYGPSCYTISANLIGYSDTGFPDDESEDCLTINVVRPSGIRPSAKLPVLVWIYGGGFQEGGTSDQRYNSSFLVQESVKLGKPIIGVSFNYRLNGFGFLPGRDFENSGILNLGLYDQRLALGWIQDNIAAFGGDASQVTIQGESAGALSVGYHFVAFGGRDDGLFRAGIGESGTALNAGPMISSDEQDIAYSDVLNKTNCTGAVDTIECLRSVDTATLRAAFTGPYYPVIDGNMVADYPSVLIDQGRFVKRPLLLGTNTNEGTSFLQLFGGTQVNTTAELAAYIANTWRRLPNETAAAAAQQYAENLSDQEAQGDLGTVPLSPGPGFGSLFGKTSLYQADIMFVAPRIFVTEKWAQYGVPTYSYRFNVIPNGYNPRILGAAHFTEIPFVFRNVDGRGYRLNPLASDSADLRKSYLRVSDVVSRTFLGFVTDLNPNANKIPGLKGKWRPRTKQSAMNIVFDLNGTRLETDNPRAPQIRFLIDSFGDYRM